MCGKIDWKISSSFVFDGLELIIYASDHFSISKISLSRHREAWAEYSYFRMGRSVVMTSAKECRGPARLSTVSFVKRIKSAGPKMLSRDTPTFVRYSQEVNPS